MIITKLIVMANLPVLAQVVLEDMGIIIVETHLVPEAILLEAVFKVEDDGCGIPIDRMDSLFTGLLDSQEPTDNSRSNMGIGLSVCRTIIKAHGSELKAVNRPEGGARFRFALEMEEQEYGK